MSRRTSAEIAAAEAEIALYQEKLSSDPRWMRRALIVLFENQTNDEQRAECTSHRNSVGFTAFDAEILTSFAKQVQAGRTLSEKQMAIAAKKLPKYAKQLRGLAHAA